MKLINLFLAGYSLVSFICMAEPSTNLKSASHSDYTEFVGVAGAVNWTKGQIIATGVGAAPPNKPPHVVPLLACRAAIADAQRNLLEAVKGVRVEATTIVEKYMLASDVIETSVKGIIRHAMITEKTTLADSTCQVKLKAPMAGNMSQNIYQAVFDQQSQKSAFYYFVDGLGHGLAWLLPKPAMAAKADEQAQLSSTNSDWHQQYLRLENRIVQLEQKLLLTPQTMPDQTQLMPTGLVIDVRGQNFMPSLSPKIRRVNGKLLYPKQQAKTAILSSGRLVSLFTRDLDFAQRHPNVGERPLVIKAQQISKQATDIILNDETADKLEALISNHFFNQAGVIVVLD